MDSPGERRKKGGNKMPARIPQGDILIDSSKKEWIIQSLIGKGGFGEIYSAYSKGEKAREDYVIKIEPSENGPLFCEKTVYIRIGKKEDIQEYLKAKKLKFIGMPTFYGSGTHLVNGKKFRFLVMERYGKDLWQIFLSENRLFPPATVYKIGVQVIEVLEYIHSKGYVHADIKGANLLLGRNKGSENNIYVVDFGLASRFTTQYKADPKKAHNGTIEYCSCDGHKGIVTRRGDIEMLGYNMLEWMSSTLPWVGFKDLKLVQTRKNNYLKFTKSLMLDSFKSPTYPKPIEKYFVYFSNMEPLEEPDYNHLKQILKKGIAATGDTSVRLEFSVKKSASKTEAKKQVSVVALKTRKMNDGRSLRVDRSGNSRRTVEKTIDISNNTSEGKEKDDDDDDDDDVDDDDDDKDDDFIETTPEKKTKVKRSWKDCPSVVSCAELLLKDDKARRRLKRNK